MKVLTEEFIDKLRQDDINNFLEECVLRLNNINYPNNYPKDKTKYKDFVNHVYQDALKYDMTQKSYFFSLLIAWHIIGEDFITQKIAHKVMTNPNLSLHDKSQTLLKLTKEEIQHYEKNTKD